MPKVISEEVVVTGSLTVSAPLPKASPADLVRFMAALNPVPSMDKAWKLAINHFNGRHVAKRAAYGAFRKVHPNLGERRGRKQNNPAT